MTDVDALQDAVAGIDAGDPDSVQTGFDAFFGHFVIEDGEPDLDHVDSVLEDHGFERVDAMGIPGMVQVNVDVADQDDGGQA